MQLDLANLPSDPELLQRLVRDIAAAIDHRDTEIERLKSIIKQLQRMQFGRSSERIDPDQLALGLEDLDSDIGRVEEAQPKATPEAKSPPRRRALPDHLPREDVLLNVQDRVCGRCGPGAASRHAYDPSEIRLPSSTPWCRRAGAVDCWRPGDARGARPRVDQQILRSPSGLSAVADLRPSWRRSLPLDARGLGWRRMLVARGLARTAVQ
nr:MULTISPECIES: transposase [unclassified Bradyrhizobium]